jgi:hypothetical protein
MNHTKISKIMKSLFAVVFLSVLWPLWAVADTFSLTASDNMTHTLNTYRSSVTYSLTLGYSDASYQRLGSDSASFIYVYNGQASAKGAGEEARSAGYLGFSFSLTPAVWQISADIDYRGVAAMSSSAGASGVSNLVLSSTGSAAGLSGTLVGAYRITKGGTTINRTALRSIATAGTGSGSVRLDLEYGAQCTGAAEAYASLGLISPLLAFDLDDTWYDSNDGVYLTLTFTPSLNFSGQTAEWDLIMNDGEILSGWGTINGEVRTALYVDAVIHPTGSGLVIGNPSVGWFRFGGAIEVNEGDLEIRDNLAELIPWTNVIVDNNHILKVKNLEYEGGISVYSGTLMLDSFQGSAEVNPPYFSGIENHYGILGANSSPINVGIDGEYIQEANGILLVKLGNAQADHFYFDRDVSLAGTLRVELLPDFVPVNNQVFTVVSFGGSKIGKFTKFELPTLPPGFFLDSSRLNTYGELRVVEDKGFFDFNDTNSLESWYMDGAYSETGAGPFNTSFSLSNYSQSLSMGQDFLYVSGNPGVWWIMKLHSPDLTNSPYWQNTVGFSCALENEMTHCGDIGGHYQCAYLYANLYVKVFDVDQQIDRYFYSGTAQGLSHGYWSNRTFRWIDLPDFPVNRIIKDIEVYIWGEMWDISLYDSGHVLLDNVEPIYCDLSADLTGDCHVTIADLSIFCEQWLHEGSPCPSADLARDDCKVDFYDFAVLVEEWRR